MDKLNPYQPPQSDTLVSLSNSESEGVSVHKKVVSIRHGCQLPPRCIVCNQPADTFYNKRFYWHPPWYGIAAIASFFGLAMLLPYLPETMLSLLALYPLLITSLILLLGRKSVIHLGVCTTHQKRNRFFRFLQIVSTIFIGIIFYGLLISDASYKIISVVVMALLSVFLMTTVLNIFRVNIRVIKITNETTKLKGFGEAFLQALR